MTNADNKSVALPSDTPSISTTPDLRSGAAWIVSEGQAVQDAFLDALSDGELLALPYIFDFWALDHQL
ncbi:MAG: ATP-binding protein, partial [Roseovarius sp.]